MKWTFLVSFPQLWKPYYYYLKYLKKGSSYRGRAKKFWARVAVLPKSGILLSR